MYITQFNKYILTNSSILPYQLYPAVPQLSRMNWPGCSSKSFQLHPLPAPTVQSQQTERGRETGEIVRPSGVGERVSEKDANEQQTREMGN